jgi:phosphopantetheinyl transferase (holo-ACP synthase)
VSTIYVGNDIVDLEEPRTDGRATDDRFVGRVFDAREQAAIRGAADPDLELWARWAAKEAGFKVVSKLIGAPPPFVHRAFRVEWTGSGSSARDDRDVVREGLVTYEEHEAHVSVLRGTGGVHAVGFGSPGAATAPALSPCVALLDEPNSPWSGALDELRSRFTERELEAVYSRQSAAVRLGARAELATALGVDEGRLEIVCDPGPASQRPPRVMLDGERARADVSLSHDGRWIAWVLWTDN